MYYAHLTKDLERKQTILEHLLGTANLAGNFAGEFECFDWGYCCGLIHDIGKYSESFQQRLFGGPIVDHASAGAKEIYKSNLLIAYCIAGHHSGLLNVGSISDLDGKTFFARMKKELKNYDDYKTEIEIPCCKEPSLQLFGKGGFSKSFFTRMLYSCLVDADYLDTEKFMNNSKINRNNFSDFDTLYNRLLNYVQPWLMNNDLMTIDGKRTEILKTCLKKGKEQQGLFSLSVPTGGGKTISSLAFALEHIKKHGLKRVIYVIPYTSIIEQNAKIFKDILGNNNILEDYYNVDYTDELEFKQKQLSTENWNAPIVTTTNVQFFESLFANKSSKCRKNHNISNSVIILDEAQMLPVNYLLPCLWALNELICNYHCTVVLSTATQPALADLFFKIKSKNRDNFFNFYQTEICPRHIEMNAFFKRTKISFIGEIKKNELIDLLKNKKQVLCILNNKRQVQSVYETIKRPGIFHLSTTMYPIHRTRTLKEIKKRLENNKTCIVIATSLVEAGVDLDFMNVYREIAGLDSILQAAGRCNREGKYNYDNSNTTIFEFVNEDAMHIPNSLYLPIKETKQILEKYDDINSFGAISEYFNNYFHDKGDSLDSKGILRDTENCCKDLAFSFESIAREFKLIEEKTISIFIAKEVKAIRILEKIREGDFTQEIMRKAGRYIIKVYQNHFEVIFRAGLLEKLGTDLFLLLINDQYDENEGLLFSLDREDTCIRRKEE